MGRRLQGLTSFTLKRRPERVGAREPLGRPDCARTPTQSPSSAHEEPARTSFNAFRAGRDTHGPDFT